MGATTFYEEGKGQTATEVFHALIAGAVHQCGHDGYTGTIAEKRQSDDPGKYGENFKVFTSAPDQGDMTDAVYKKMVAGLIDGYMDEVDDKWGPAGCIQIGSQPDHDGNFTFVFFGLASE